MKLQELIEEIAKIKQYKQLSFHFGKITNVELFINTHVSYLRSNPKNMRYIPYYNRLMELYEANK